MKNSLSVEKKIRIWLSDHVAKAQENRTVYSYLTFFVKKMNKNTLFFYVQKVFFSHISGTKSVKSDDGYETGIERKR